MILPMMLESASSSEITAWNGIGLGSIIMIVLFIITVVTFFFGIKSNRRADNKEAQERSDRITADISKISSALEPRLVRLEDKTTDFLRKSEIERMVDHEKVNRVQALTGLKDKADKADQAIIDLKIQRSKIEQKHVGLEDDVSEIKDLLKDQRKETNEKLDKLAACLAEISKNV